MGSIKIMYKEPWGEVVVNIHGHDGWLRRSQPPCPSRRQRNQPRRGRTSRGHWLVAGRANFAPAAIEGPRARGGTVAWAKPSIESQWTGWLGG